VLVTGVLLGWASMRADTRQADGRPAPDLGLFFDVASRERETSERALEALGRQWKDDYAALIVDMARFMLPEGRPGPAAGAGPGPEFGISGDPDTDDRDPLGARGDDLARTAERRGSPIRARLVRFLEQATGQRFGDDLARWRKWIWDRPYDPHPEYATFKAAIYGQVDPRMQVFFRPEGSILVRLDEIDWGGVKVNGIPPLVDPKVIPAADAGYLKDGHVVFGVEVEGAARAYPKRILAWHELARDRIGGVDLTIVYCTLCGTVIPFESVAGDRRWTFGTSGLLYRSNKLMFDEETGSLWSSLEGVPVVGPLAGSGLRLTYRSVVTTTWGEWRRLHPATTVLSLETGYDRDYSEGAAYRAYFATDRLMFGVSQADDRLRNKDEVLVMRLPAPGASAAEATPVAIATKHLRRRPVFQDTIAGHPLVILTSREGASRVYEARSHQFRTFTREGSVIDAGGRAWTLTETHLVSDEGERLPRVPAHSAFWFGWYAQFPETLLIGARD
jgi:hypothetical protein